MHNAVCLFTFSLSLFLWLPGAAVAFTEAEIDQAALVARQIDLVNVIADDSFRGRQNNTADSAAIRALLIDELQALPADGLDSAETGDAAYEQPFSLTAAGTNLLAVIPGTDLADEYVMIGAHYDHLGAFGSTVFNGATDNAAGVAIVLAAGKAIRSLPTPPRRSVILALWDAEEDGLVGSRAFSLAPLVPLDRIVGYVNLDIQGSNLLPTLRDVSFAVGAESGDTTLQAIVGAAIGRENLDTRFLSRLFGQDRSDHVNFVDNGVPSVFFTDATGGCYHTPGDDLGNLDFGKLREQSQIAFRVLLALAETPTPPPFVQTGFVATYDDAVTLLEVASGVVAELDRFSALQQGILLQVLADIQAIVDDGPENFTVGDVLTLALAAGSAVDALTTLPCDGFVLPNEPPVADAGPDQTLECTAPDATDVTLDGTGSFDPDGDPLSYEWTHSFGSTTGPTPTATLSGLVDGNGMETISLSVDDGQAIDTDTVKITVQDTTAPVATVALEPVFKSKKSKKATGVIVRLGCEDACDPSPGAEAALAGRPVGDGEFISAKALKKARKAAKKTRSRGKGKKKKSKKQSPVLELVCTDAAGNQAGASSAD